MSQVHEHDHHDAHEHAMAQPPFRFEAFADAPSAQAAFEAVYSVGSPIAQALQALVDMGGHCRQVSPARIACRYVEEKERLLCRCWHVVLEIDSEKAIRGVSVSLGVLGP